MARDMTYPTTTVQDTYGDSLVVYRRTEGGAILRPVIEDPDEEDLVMDLAAVRELRDALTELLDVEEERAGE